MMCNQKLAEILTAGGGLNGKIKYGIFRETYPLCAFAMAISLVYPNKHNTRVKIIAACIILGLNSIAIFWFFTYLVKCLYRLDIYNFTRNMTVGVLVFLFFFKSFYANYHTDLFIQIIDMMDNDLARANELEEDYHEIYDHFIKIGRFGQKCWIVIPILLSSMFPISATGTIIYRIISGDLNTRVMVHEMELMFLEDKKYVTPIYEILFLYNIYQCASVAPVYAGFDGSFCISTTHLCLKLKLVSHKLARAFRDANNEIELEERVKEVIKDHIEALRFHKLIQDAYGGWLFMAFLLTSTLVSFNLYQISVKNGAVEPFYVIFTLCAVAHMFTPCYFASSLTQVGRDVCDEIYGVQWESKLKTRAAKLIIFMLARQQKDFVLTGKGVVVFNMELFISIMQTSYSFFTLIRA